ncbi:MAG: hypothetical protein KDA63_17115, partial [Planctomycetales bacterium]|nr:hypothetical protein [Planctomycetales bacterium]
MSTVHTIRLHGPWSYEVVHVEATEGQDAPLRGRFSLDDGLGDVLGASFRGSAPGGSALSATVRLARRFNCPTGLGAHNRVWLVIESTGDVAAVALNE